MLKKVIITVKEPEIDRLHDVSNQLQHFSMKISNIMDDYGIIIGEVDVSYIPAIDRLSWVESIEEDQDVNLY